ncbi:hypothetical protein M0D46_17750 [Xanthomonas prunicola]|uniref:hypothetical protein n=1 Tax=Xanthomonas prunicola TaxID=2053930 RepID=UPI0021B1BD12|nr:hypothetical protein [Xanthomonas prunicola]UXA68875.1 hypothetical protein M0D46_17750 [Xanthomonas prunicola]
MTRFHLLQVMRKPAFSAEVITPHRAFFARLGVKRRLERAGGFAAAAALHAAMLAWRLNFSLARGMHEPIV